MNNSRVVVERGKAKKGSRKKIPPQALERAQEFAKRGNLNVYLLSLKIGGNEELANQLKYNSKVQAAIDEGIELRKTKKKRKRPKRIKKEEGIRNELKEKGNISVLESRKSIYLTPSELKVLRYLEENRGNLTYKKIQKDTGVSPGIISKALAKLREVEHPSSSKIRKSIGGIKKKKGILK